MYAVLSSLKPSLFFAILFCPHYSSQRLISFVKDAPAFLVLLVSI